MKPELGEIVAALLLLSAVAAAGAEAATTAADTTLLPPALAADLAAHLGLPPSWQRQAVAWKPDQVALTRSLIGAGFHRELELELSVVVGEDAAGDGALSSSSSCDLIVAQHLPNDFYADPYQLQDLERAGNRSASVGGGKSGGGASYELLGPLDLEL